MRKAVSIVMACALAAAVMGGCSSAPKEARPEAVTAAESTVSETSREAGAGEGAESSEASGGGKEQAETESKAKVSQEAPGETAALRIGSLKGPTTMGMVSMMDKAAKGEVEGSYEFTMVTAADELVGKMVSGNLDIALVPANVASVLYGRTEGQVAVIDINTLGVLYGVTADNSIQSIGDLAGKTVYMTGKGTTPDYVFQYLLEANGIQDQVALEFKSEPGEVAALLANQPEAIGILPQPFVTVACAQNEALGIALDLTAEWDKAQEEKGSQMVTGVTLVRKEFLEKHPDAVSLFLKDHEKSAAYTKEQPDQAAELIVKAGIIEKAPVAKKALPYCNITCITGQEMKAALSGYLQVLFDRDPKSVGGKMPEDDFYFIEP